MLIAYGYNYSSYLAQNQDNIARLCVDEAHVLVTESHYRQAFERIIHAQTYTFQKVFVTGTLPPRTMPAFFKITGLNPDTHIIRTPTSRPELAYRLVTVTTTAKINTATLCLAHYFHHHTFAPHSRGIIYVHTPEEATKLSSQLGCLCYSAKLNKQQRSLAQKQWRIGATQDHQWIVATSAFSHGIDQPFVVAVIFAGHFYDFFKFVQAAARGGRKDSVRCDVVVFHTAQGVKVENPDPCLAKEYNEWFSDKTQCRRIGISRAMDGPEHIVTCSTLPHAELCDFCDKSLVNTPIKAAIQHAINANTPVLPLSSSGLTQIDDDKIFDDYLENNPLPPAVLEEIDDIELQYLWKFPRSQQEQQAARKRPASDEGLPPSNRQKMQPAQDGSRHQSSAASLPHATPPCKSGQNAQSTSFQGQTTPSSWSQSQASFTFTCPSNGKPDCELEAI